MTHASRGLWNIQYVAFPLLIKAPPPKNVERPLGTVHIYRYLSGPVYWCGVVVPHNAVFSARICCLIGERKSGKGRASPNACTHSGWISLEFTCKLSDHVQAVLLLTCIRRIPSPRTMSGHEVARDWRNDETMWHDQLLCRQPKIRCFLFLSLSNIEEWSCSRHFNGLSRPGSELTD